jgi:hypothetical protein
MTRSDGGLDKPTPKSPAAAESDCSKTRHTLQHYKFSRVVVYLDFVFNCKLY